MSHSNVKPQNRAVGVGEHKQSFEMWSILAQFVLVLSLAGEFTDTFVV